MRPGRLGLLVGAKRNDFMTVTQAFGKFCKTGEGGNGLPSAAGAAVTAAVRRRRPPVARHLHAQLPAVEHATVHRVQCVFGVALVVEPASQYLASRGGFFDKLISNLQSNQMSIFNNKKLNDAVGIKIQN